MIDAQTLAQMTHWRHDIHRHPELAYEETRTADIVANELRSLGMEVHTGLAKTGVVGVLTYGTGEGPMIGLRADMDALPITETTGLEYASEVSGQMHACGHDGHTTMLLGAARFLAQNKSDDLNGQLIFIFQPAEENEGGARTMIEEGLFDRFPVDMVFGLHNMPGVPVGTVMAQPGPVSAAFDTFSLTIQGQGGHGAMPENTRDPLPAASALVSALNSVVSRNIRPLDAAVISIGQLEGGQAYNVIPDQMTLKGSCRSLTADSQKILKRRVYEICEGIGKAYAVDISCDYQECYPAVCNTDYETDLVCEALSNDQDPFTVITEFEPVMGSEDFSYFLNEKPGCYFIIGNGDQGGPLHSPTYQFNDELLSLGAMAWVRIVQKILNS